MAWERLDEATSTPWAGPLCAAEDAEGQEHLFMVGGSSPSRPPVVANDFDDVLGEDVPMELWSRPLRGSFQRRVLAFPPKARAGASWTQLSAERLLLFGGRCAGRCLADVHILQLRGSRSNQRIRCLSGKGSPCLDSDSEGEAIFFASEYRAACAEQPKEPTEAQAKAGKPKRPQEMVKRKGLDAASSESEEEPAERPNLSRAMPCSMEDVLAMASQVTMTRRSEEVKGPGSRPIRRKSGGDDFPEARWRQPQALEEHTPPRPRAGHTAVLQVPVVCGETPAVLIYGGLGDGGLPLGDTFELRLLETEDQSLEFVWSLLDRGKEHCETVKAPWEQPTTPRPRTCHSAVFWSGSQRSMVVFGGLGMGLEGEPKAQGDCWLYLVGQRHAQAGGWKRPTLTGGAPARRWGHGACMVGDAMLICGGADASTFGDCWLLQLPTMRWEQLEMSLPRAPKDLGRCQALWSSSERQALLWSCHGAWCFAPAPEPKDESLWGALKPVALPRSELPPVRAAPWKAADPKDADAFHQSWPQHTPRKTGPEKRPVASAVGRERPSRELGPVKPPKKGRPPMKC